MVLPYDFEIPSHKLIIEVQGEQHQKFAPDFHDSVLDFEYQQYKDNFKKKFAENNGYKVLYIYYDELCDSIINKKLHELFG